MDTTQLLLSTAVTITTVLLIVVSVQLISLLKQLKRDYGKENTIPIKLTETKKEKATKKKINLTILLEKMKNRISHPHASKKRFFKS